MYMENLDSELFHDFIITVGRGYFAETKIANELWSGKYKERCQFWSSIVQERNGGIDLYATIELLAKEEKSGRRKLTEFEREELGSGSSASIKNNEYHSYVS